MKKPSRQGRRGTTLIEAMASVAVFAVGVLGIMQANVLASSQNALAKRQAGASAIARDMIDSFERIPYTHSLLSVSSIAITSPDFVDVSKGVLHDPSESIAATDRPIIGASDAIVKSDGLLAGSSIYTIKWRVAPILDSGGVEQAKAIVVIVRTRMPGGGVKQLEMWTTKYNPLVLVNAATMQEI
jgi:hypothetical protein